MKDVTATNLIGDNMARPQKTEKHLIDKYHEIVWALSVQDDYSDSAIGKIMNRHRSVIGRVIKKRPKDYKPKWIKATV